MITSSSNQQMKNILALEKKAKERKNQGLFVVEGRKMYEEVLKPGWKKCTCRRVFWRRMKDFF